MNKTELNRWKKRLILFLHNYKYVLLVALVGGFLLLLPPLWGENDGEPAAAENSSQTEEEAAYSAETLERRLEEALSKIEGAGEVEVVLTLKSGPQKILAQDTETSVDEQGSESSLTTVILSRGSGNEEAMVVQQFSPRYQGALVICSGGNDPEVRLRLAEAVSALTGLGTDKISVCKGK